MINNVICPFSSYRGPRPNLVNFRPGVETASLLVAGPSYLVVLALRLTASAASIFGQMGKAYSNKWHHKADKLYAIYVAHNLANLSTAPLPLLTRAKNLARRDVLIKEEDLSAALKVHEYFLKEHPSLIPQKENFKQAETRGLCFAASLWFIKAVQHATSEEQLISIAKEFSEGFPSEVAGLQLQFINFIERCNLDQSDKIDKTFAKFKEAVMNRLKIMPTAVQMDLLRKGPNIIYKLVERIKQTLDHFNKTGILVPIKADPTEVELIPEISELVCAVNDIMQAHKKIIETQQGAFSAYFGLRQEAKAEIKNFDTFSMGGYQVQIPVGSSGQSGHAIAYLKFPFGSYLFDPNYGLMKCGSTQDLHTLLHEYKAREPAIYHFI